METKTFLFKTNINCSGCIASLKPHLDKKTEIENWQVDTTNPDKVLKVETSELSPEQIIATISKAGFKAESLS